MTDQLHVHTIGIVIPVYKGELVLGPLVEEIEAYAPTADTVVTSPGGNRFVVTEIVLVHDCGPDDSARIIREIAERDVRVRPAWLSRNYGQHAATLAGIATTSSDWVVTMDEDGQHNPTDIGSMLDVAIGTSSQVVYARPTNAAPHGWLRNSASAAVKWIADKLIAGEGLGEFSSYRLVLGEVVRAIAGFGGHGVYFDVALTWVAKPSQICPVVFRSEARSSGYSMRGLIKHFGRLLISSGVRPLRLIALLGALVAFAGFLFAAYAVVARVQGAVQDGWTSVIVAVLVMGGLILIALGIIAEYLAVVVGTAMGRPSYLLVTDPVRGPLGRLATPVRRVEDPDSRQP